jgi:transcriptional regulator with XRE-family HTH domain
LRAVRVANGVSQSELAAKLGFKRQAWAQFEASEARGAISLASLRRAADALGCDFFYHVVPREGSRAGVRGSKKQVRRAPTQLHEAGERARAAIPTQEQVTQAEAPPSVSPFSSEQELPMELR